MFSRAILTLMLLTLTAVARAGSTPAEKCAASKTAAAGANVNGSAKCYATSLKKGAPLDPSCLGKADAKLDSAFVKAEKAGGCVVTGDLAAVKNSVANLCLGSFTGAIAGDPKCAPLKMKSVGKKTSDQATCTKKAILKGAPVDAACLGKADTSFQKAIATADGKGSCTGTAAALDAASGQCGDAIAAPVTPIPSATPTPSPTPGATGTPTPIPTPPPHSCPAFASSDECLGTLGSGSSIANCFNICVNFICVVPCGETCPDPAACSDCLNANGLCADYCCP